MYIVFCINNIQDLYIDKDVYCRYTLQIFITLRPWYTYLPSTADIPTENGYLMYENFYAKLCFSTKNKFLSSYYIITMKFFSSFLHIYLFYLFSLFLFRFCRTVPGMSRNDSRFFTFNFATYFIAHTISIRI